MVNRVLRIVVGITLRHGLVPVWHKWFVRPDLVMNFLVMPIFFLSGALFPLSGSKIEI